MPRVLLIEDNADTALSLKMLLEAVGHTAETAKDGGEGMLKIGTFAPDVVVLDLMLPNVNGWELLDSKDKTAARNIPVIVCSGWAEIPQPLTGKQVVAVLTKPVEPAELIDTIQRVTEKGGAQ